MTLEHLMTDLDAISRESVRREAEYLIDREINFWRRTWAGQRRRAIEARELAASFAAGPQPCAHIVKHTANRIHWYCRDCGQFLHGRLS